MCPFSLPVQPPHVTQISYKVLCAVWLEQIALYAGMALLQPALAKEASFRHLDSATEQQLVSLAAAASACLAAASDALQVSVQLSHHRTATSFLPVT